ncbi:hypothetical protein BDU57DRAFT_509727, partial [Ampelomyces quisqualis]
MPRRVRVGLGRCMIWKVSTRWLFVLTWRFGGPNLCAGEESVDYSAGQDRDTWYGTILGLHQMGGLGIVSHPCRISSLGHRCTGNNGAVTEVM